MSAPGVQGRLVLLLSAAVTLLVLAAGSAATPRKSSQDQYEQQLRDAGRATHAADGGNILEHHQQQPLLHHRVHSGHHRFSVLPPGPSKQAASVPELQVGCAEGSVDVRTELSHEKQPDAADEDDISIAFAKNSLRARHKRQIDGHRERRDYVNWYGSGSTQDRQPQPYPTYQLASPLPYYVPLWGNPRRVPVFFPSKPILFNPGYPVKNRPSAGPATGGPATNNAAGVVIGNRIGADDDAPVWGVVESDEPAAAAQPQRRKPSPPLLHQPSGAESEQASQLQDKNPLFGQDLSVNFRPRPPATTVPPANFRPMQPVAATVLPPRATQAPTRRPAGGNAAEPNRCVWAIISCCSPASQEVRYNCFERLGCPGAFWDNSPCSREVTVAALNAAQKFYDQS